MGTFSLHFVEALLTIGVPRERAQSLAELLERGIDERYSLHSQVLATKRDLADLELKLVREMAQRSDQTNERISKMEASLRADINETRLSIAESKSEIIKWNLGALVALSGMLIAVIKLST